ncbi:SMRP1 protein, partial [Nothoprocta pentlandii]|nr:SMRP1 protein [Nothoprocta pentlandii]
MFLFAQETKTPVSTYTDSYRPPNSVKKTFQEPPSLLWKENKFVTKGLAMPPVPSAGSPGQQERLLKAAAQELAYRNAVEPSAYQPEKYWVTRQEERYNPVFVNEDRYVTWRTSPYNSAAWNKYTTYLPRLPKPPAPIISCSSRCSKAISGTLPAAAARAPPPAAPPVYAPPARRPYQGYFSPCSGRHYCLRGMDYYGDVGRPDTGRHLHPLAERAVSNMPLDAHGCPGTDFLLFFLTSSSARLRSPCLSPMFISSPRWDSSHFKKAGGVQRGTFTIHPEFVSESCSAPWG